MFNVACVSACRSIDVVSSYLILPSEDDSALGDTGVCCVCPLILLPTLGGLNVRDFPPFKIYLLWGGEEFDEAAPLECS